MYESPFADADWPFELVFRGSDPLDICEKPFALDNPSACMIARRLRLRDGGWPSARPVGKCSCWGAASRALRLSSDELPLLASEGSRISELLERKRRRRGFDGRRFALDGACDGADKTSEEDKSVSPTEIAGESMGKGSSGWSGVKDWRNWSSARSRVVQDLPSPLALK